jgi:formylglycine-generating enzyme required for sulfatase activity
VELGAFRIDRTEVANAAFGLFGAMVNVTGVGPPPYPDSADLDRIGDPDRPVAGITWAEARAFCRYMGKQLPTSQQWQRALRGGERLSDGTMNPAPRRNLPWGDERPLTNELTTVETRRPAAIGAFPSDQSPDGIMDLAGNVTEWTDSVTVDGTDGIRVVRGGGWSEIRMSDLVDALAMENPRAAVLRFFDLGVRCASGKE